MFYGMIKTITKIGNSQGIMLDAALMDLAHLKVGDQVNLTVHEGGAVYFTPVHPVLAPDEAAASARRIVARNRDLFRRLA
jgi:antitoxin component of MazEF toxin-antitoxin module